MFFPGFGRRSIVRPYTQVVGVLNLKRFLYLRELFPIVRVLLLRRMIVTLKLYILDSPLGQFDMGLRTVYL